MTNSTDISRQNRQGRNASHRWGHCGADSPRVLEESDMRHHQKAHKGAVFLIVCPSNYSRISASKS
ncbi:hypothetical protein KSP40_PGU012055 [Platanthera guangdongensis]|uniref:Uncharacterized protein n=1 Tax=Platanthera guangdongensis TaxID=2320717 RepID=A0ABR2LGH4_9ASPA